MVKSQRIPSLTWLHSSGLRTFTPDLIWTEAHSYRTGHLQWYTAGGSHPSSSYTHLVSVLLHQTSTEQRFIVTGQDIYSGTQLEDPIPLPATLIRSPYSYTRPQLNRGVNHLYRTFPEIKGCRIPLLTQRHTHQVSMLLQYTSSEEREATVWWHEVILS